MNMVLKRLRSEEKGFTLIELLAVIVILAVIAVIAYPLIGNIIGKSKTDADLATARQIYDAARLHAVATGDGTVTAEVFISTLQPQYLDAPLYLPSTKELIDASTSSVGGTGSSFVLIKNASGTTLKSYTKEQVLSQK